MEGTYRLRYQTNRSAGFAEVTVLGAAAAQPDVLVAPDVFGWRRGTYDERNAEDERACTEARDGAWYALTHLPADAPDLLVSVVGIVTAPADTGPGHVKFAAAQAVWLAAGHAPHHPPWIDETGTPVFP
ncbi:hypothetical protein [Streptomyces sp. NPDC092129]|uniref:hypothetical protein n=1 Tax=Streptomyces sp. NPDC092129 TaxID=3366010 RepID=UPI0038010F5A